MTAAQRRLEGFGAGLVREAALAGRVQAGLERLYRLDRSAEIGDFMRLTPDGEREALLVRETDDGVEIALQVPALDGMALDPLCQLIEGVSHFVLLTERARHNATVSQLELELQAEIDKYLVLGQSLSRFDEQSSAALRAQLYEQISFSHDQGSELGDRYRLANRMAANYTGSLERRFVRQGRLLDLRHEVRAFFHAARGDKLLRAAA